MAARIAAQGGLKGIAFDTEHYHGRVFDYQKQRQRQKGEKTFREFTDVARKRGRQFMKAIAEEYPDVTILMFMAASFAADDMWHQPGTKLEEVEFGLMPAFMDGMLDASTERARIIDGFERAYNMTEHRQFVWGRNLIKNETAPLSADPDRYRKRIGVGFGIAMPWHSPQALGDAMHYALSVADEYVWVWSDVRNYHWATGRVPRDRLAALVNARKPRGSDRFITPDQLPGYWGPRGPTHHAEAVERRGYSPLAVADLGYLSADATPAEGSARFPARSVALDFNQVSVVLDMAKPVNVDVIQLYASYARRGNVNLTGSNVQLYTSNDNKSYTLARYIYGEPDPFVIELSGIGIKARYFKVHSTIKVSSGGSWEFSAGTDYGGASAFERKPRQ